MRFPRLAAPVAACVVTALALPLPVAAAAPRPARSSVERVLLTLKPQDRHALRSLARDTARTRSHRAAVLQRALPSAAQQRSVVAAAESLGLTVERIGTLSVLVSGPAARIDTLFGSARAVAPRSKVQHPLPTIPAQLRGSVTAAFGGDDHRPAFRHFALSDGSLDGTDLRTAYGDSDTDPVTLPADPAAAAATKTESIATVQLSGWHSSDLTDYAASLRNQTGQAWPAPAYKGIDDPLLPSKIATRSTSPNFGNDLEVALDQEAIYAMAPYAHQRAYLSGNDLLGMYDSLTAIGDDASDPTADHHIVAASISWGFCETDIAGESSAKQLYAAFEDVLSYDLAAGVTMFAASGDNGTTCDGTKTGVSYPASSPHVVSVGGTQTAEGGSASDPTAQQPWHDQYGDTGGGVSRVWPQPSYQQAAGAGAPCPAASGLTAQCRTVPDVAAAAGAPGFNVVSSSAAGEGLVGGTSLASPVTAAGFAVQVAAHGYSWGVGDILPGLYAQQSAFNDVGPAGYDQETGLGAPDWSALVSSALGGNPHLSVGVAYSPTTTIPVTAHIPDWQSYDSFRIDVDVDHSSGSACQLTSGDSPAPPTSVQIQGLGYPGSADGVHQLTLVALKGDSTGQVVCRYSDAYVLVDTRAPLPRPSISIDGQRDLVANWAAADGGGSGIKRYAVTLRQGNHRVLSLTSAHSGFRSVRSKPGRVYTLAVTATDRAGNSRTSTAQLVDDRQFSSASPWASVKRRSAFDATLSSTAHVGAKSRVRLQGRVFRLYVETCPSCGKLGVYVGGKLRKKVDTYSAHRHHRVGVTVLALTQDRPEKLVLKPLRQKNRHSNGRTISLDAAATKG